MTQRVHEEPLTGFLLGAFASLAPLCSSVFDDTDEARCEWQYFSKSGTGPLTEPATGADFALIIENDGQLPRLAIFQAKRENKIPLIASKFIKFATMKTTTGIHLRRTNRNLYVCWSMRRTPPEMHALPTAS
jgi:hypothetical protein